MYDYIIFSVTFLKKSTSNGTFGKLSALVMKNVIAFFSWSLMSSKGKKGIVLINAFIGV